MQSFLYIQSNSANKDTRTFNKLCFPETTNRTTIETVQGNHHI